MAYLTTDALLNLGFKALGSNVKISDKASIYDSELIEIGDNSRIDDFCVISGNIKIGRNVHITPQCLIAGGRPGIVIEDFSTLAYGVKVFTQSDDYSGATMTNSTVPSAFKNEIEGEVHLKKHTIIGANSTIFPNVILKQGTSVGANSLVLESTEAWSIYVGSPARKIKNRQKELLKLEQRYLREEGQ